MQKMQFSIFFQQLVSVAGLTVTKWSSDITGRQVESKIFTVYKLNSIIGK